MSQGIQIDIQPAADGSGGFECTVQITDPSQRGRDAAFSILRKVEVKDKRPVSKEDELFHHSFVCGANKVEHFEIPKFPADHFSYDGPHIRVQLLVRVVINDGYIYDTTVEEALSIPLTGQPVVATCAKSIVDPEDCYDLLKNVRALPPETQISTSAVGMGGLAFIVANTVCAIRDSMGPSHKAWVYSMGSVPANLILSMFLSLIVGFIAYRLLHVGLKTYADLELVPRRIPLRRGEALMVSDLFRGRARVPLENFLIRVVVCNYELGQYVRGSGTNTRTVSFTEPVRGIVLYSKIIERVPRGADLTQFVDDVIDFDPMFDGLYPPQVVTETHGLDVRWELQLVHDDFVDLELKGGNEWFAPEEFLDGGVISS